MKKILLMIFGIILTVTGIENTEFDKIDKALDELQNLLKTEFSSFEMVTSYIEDYDEQITSLGNTEHNLKELLEVSKSIAQHLDNAKITFLLLKRLKNFHKEDKDPSLSTVSKCGFENVTEPIDQYESLKVVDNPENRVFDDHAQKLCNGEISLTPDISKDLKCRYTDKGNLFLKIGPFKIEEAFFNPDIIIYHNILNDEEMDTLKDMSYPWLEESLVTSVNDGPHKSNIRVSKNVWLTDEDHKYVANVNRRVELATDLSVSSAEYLQVSYYQKDGYFNTHVDFDQNKTHPFEGSDFGNRIATLMFYLSDVEKGGKTIFPNINVSLTPEKGSAVFWYNLFPNGEFDYDTLHAGCPVVAGTKWVANKWIHEIGQEFRRPCTLLNYEWGEDGILSVK